MAMEIFACLGVFIILFALILGVTALMRSLIDDCDSTLVWILTSMLAAASLACHIAQNWGIL